LIVATLVATVVFILARLGNADEIFLWLAMALTAIAAANMLSAVGGGRYTLGWTLGRLSWVISASVLFLYFMRRYARHQRLLVRTAEVLERRVAARTSELETSSAQLKRSLDERNVLLRDVQHKTIALTESRARLVGVVDSAMDAIISVDERHHVVLFNAAAERMFQRKAQDVLGRALGQLLPARYRAAHGRHINVFAQTGVTTRAMGMLGALSALRADGTEFPIEASISQSSIGGERLFTVILRDITERKRAENALSQTQRMDALGQLSGGIAHDFNNVLAAISSNLDVVTLRSADEKIHEVIQNAMDAIQMGASLTRRLLLLSSHQEVGLERMDLNDRVTGTIELLRRTLGEQVTVSLRLSPDPCQMLADPGDVDNAIINLAINARDAMLSGGMLTIETRLVLLDADVAGRIANAWPGEYVMLTVGDTGHGMSPEIIRCAMEPFFTTKEPGKGTGLGLATVHSTVRQSGGFVAIDSTEGEGTSVHVYFPKAGPGPIVSRAAPSPKEAPLGDGELILLVEDYNKVREATANRLESLGYAVLEAKTGSEAITLLESGEPIALVFCDIVMPGGMTGFDVAEWVQLMKPEVKVLMTSGYSDMPLAVSEAGRKIKVLGKPYTREQLACALREALDG
jgi:PAS domain S-box-containing protein